MVKTLLSKISLIIVLVIFTIGSVLVADNIEKWPRYTIKPEYKDIVIKSRNSYFDAGIDYKKGISDYVYNGDYLNYGAHNNYHNSERLQFDKDGIPKVKYDNQFYYNPVTISQYALTLYGEYVHGKDTLPQFVKVADKLISQQDGTGAFRYPFSFQYYLTGETYKPGWVSGMAQGQALSVLARAYYITKDDRYLQAGNKALDFLIKPVTDGGTMDTLADLDPSLKKYIIFEEYLAEPASYTLNGFMFTLLGLYDWTQVSSGEQKKIAQGNFERGIDTLVKILPYYDIGGFSAYDMGHIVYKAKPHIGIGYHAVHINLLHALHSITNNKELEKFEDLWASYVDK